MPPLSRLARLFVLAGSFSLPSLALAAPGAVPPRPQVVGVVQLSPAQLRAEAMRVELAWLADPTAYALPLDIYLRGDSLEARGNVPDQTTRQHVLEVARQSCYLSVHDGLTIQPGKPGVVQVGLVQVQVRDVLVRHLGNRALDLQVSVAEDGQVLLKGEVSSVEDKLIASRCLRGLAGCTRVVNCLGVQMAPAERKAPVTQPWADLPSAAMPIQQVSSIKTETPAPISKPKQAPKPLPDLQMSDTAPYVLPSGLPCSAYRVVHHGSNGQVAATYVTPPAGYVSPASAPAAPQASQPTCPHCAAGMQQPAKVKQASFLDRLLPGRKSADEQPTPSSSGIAPGLVAPGWSANDRMDMTPTTWARPVTPSPSGVIYQSRPLAGLAAPQTPAGTPPAQPAPPVVQPVAVRTTKPAPAATPPAAVATTPGAPLKTSATELTRMVQKACGKLAEKVRVEIAADRSYIVHIHAKPATEQQLVTKLLSLPALAASNVKLNVHLAQ